MALTSPVCLQYLKRCCINELSSAEQDMASYKIKADSLILTDIKAIPILLNLASSYRPFKTSKSNAHVYSNVQVYIIPSSYKVGCLPKTVSSGSDFKSKERYEFLKWCHLNLKGVTVYNPPMNHCQAAYMQALAASLSSQSVIVSSETFTSGFNGLGVLTLNESIPNCESLIMGKPLEFKKSKIVGIEVRGDMPLLAVSTDLVLQFIKFVRPLSDCIVEVWGESLKYISLSDRIAISNMVKETNVSCIFFPCDDVCATFLKSASDLLFTDRKVKVSKAPVDASVPRKYDTNYIFNLAEVVTSISGPKRASDRILLNNFQSEFKRSIYAKFSPTSFGIKDACEDETSQLHGTVIGMSLAGCTNSSNAFVTLHAGLLAKALIDKGFKLPAEIQGYYATGAGLADLYLSEAGLSEIIVQFGLQKSGSCCIDGRSKSLSPFPKNAVTCALLSGNGNYENRKFSDARANYLMSSPLAILLAAVGNVNVDLSQTHITLQNGETLEMGNIWPCRSDLIDLECKVVLPKVCAAVYKDLSTFSSQFDQIEVQSNQSFDWNPASLYILRPPYLEMRPVLGDVDRARVLLSLGDDVSSELISPSGSMSRNSTAAQYLSSKGLAPKEYDSYGNRRGNHNIVAMGIFNNNKLRNNLVSIPGPFTKHIPSNSIVDIYEAARMYKKSGTATVIVAGSNYGCGPTRDSGARGLRLLGVSAVIARSFNPNHRSELINQGVMPVLCEDADCIDVCGEVSLSWCNLDSVECEGWMSWGNLRSNTNSNSSSNLISNSSSNLISNSSSNSRNQSGTLPLVQQNALATSVSCNGSVRIRLAVFTRDELDVLECGGLLQWRVRDVEEKTQRSLEKQRNQLKVNQQMPHPMPPVLMPPLPLPAYNPVLPNMMPPYYAPPYPEVVQFVPVVQYVPVPFSHNQQTVNFVPAHEPYNNL